MKLLDILRSTLFNYTRDSKIKVGYYLKSSKKIHILILFKSFYL